MKSSTNIYILLKNLKRFVNDVPINPKSPKHKAWEKDRAEMIKALKVAEKRIREGTGANVEVYIKDCGPVPSRRALLTMLR